jgi:hypothetical protein
MSGNTLLIRNIVFAVIFLFIGTNVSPAMVGDTVEKTSLLIGCESVRLTSKICNGSLSGYVNDTMMNPIEGVLIRVYFHETYAEDYTDTSGYYHVTDIPICFCLKNTTATKLGYKTEWVLLAIDVDTTYDFVLTYSEEHNGSLSGYVKDKSMNPIESALVRVYFHETYEENYTDSSGYYKVNNIPICWCLKNCTAIKSGYKSEWVLLPIDENTTYNFFLTNNKTSISDEKNKQAIKDFFIQFLERFQIFERLFIPIFNRILYS